MGAREDRSIYDARGRYGEVIGRIGAVSRRGARGPSVAGVIVSCLVAHACGPSRPSLRPIALPDLSRVDRAVQAQARERHQSLTERINDRKTTLAALSGAYGELGKLLHAAEFRDAAEPCYLNAETLAPDEIRW